MKVGTEHSRSGLTLPEVIIGVAVVALVGGLLVLMMIQSAGLFSRESSKISQGVGLNDSLSKIESSIRKSSGALASSNSSQLALKFPAIDGSGNIIANTFDTEIFILEEDKLKYKLLPDPQSSRIALDTILTKNIESLDFKYLDNLNQEVTATLAKKVIATISLKEQIASAEANLRND